MTLLSDGRPQTGGKKFDLPIERQSGERVLVDRTDVLRRRALDLHAETRELNESATEGDLAARQQEHAKKSPVDMLAELSLLGLAWRDIARMVGVTVAALQKWRRGDGTSGENRAALAKILALMEMLTDRFISEPASWLEMPIREGVAVTPLDLIAGNRYDLVLGLASGHESESPESALDAFEPGWRSSRVDSVFETYVAADGVVSIRPRSDAG